MNFNSRSDIKASGFTGFKKISDLCLDDSCIPDSKGVYLVITPIPNRPMFWSVGVGGFLKGKNPNVTIDVLKKEWVNNAQVIYIGKAGGRASNATLKKRLKQYLRFGQGKKVGHYGGRYIWQLKNYADLIFCWQITNDQYPEDVEQNLIDDFRRQFNARPFANLKG
jgi:hypothetical protein